MKRQALIIGINRYPWLKDKPTDEGKHLDAPYHDAIAITEMLDRPQEHPDFAWCVERLLSDKETGKVVRANELRDAIRNLFLPNTQTPPEVALLFFAGHGLRDNNGKVYLAHSNVKPKTGEWGFPLDELREWMQESKIPHQIVFLDCCHSGDLVQGMASLTAAEVQQWNLGGSRFIVAACRDDLEAKGVGKRGVLTEELIKGLDPKNQPANQWVTTYSLYDFLDRQIANNSLLRQQIPLLYPPAKSIKFWMGTNTDTSLPTSTLEWWKSLCQQRLEQQHAISSKFITGIAPKIEDVYVPLGLVERKEKSRKKEGDESDPAQGSAYYEETEITRQFQHDEFLENVLRRGDSPKSKGKRLVILGEPGAGKTTLLQQVSRWVAAEIDDAVVLWVSLADLAGRNLDDYLLEIWLRDTVRMAGKAIVTETDKNDLVGQFDQERVWLFLDGADEMAASNPLFEIDKQIRNSGLLHKAQIVLTCRLNLWDAGSNPLAEFDVYRTLDFDYPVQVEQFINSWFTALGKTDAPAIARGKQLCTALKEPGKERIQDLVKNPLRLTLLCFTWKERDGKLPDTKAGLYEKFVEQFYEWKENQFPLSDEKQQELNKALGELAREAIDKESTRFRLRHKFVSKFLGSRKDKGSLFDLALKVGWLNQVGVDENNPDEPVYAFYHASFQEYFAAISIDDWDFFLPRDHVDKPIEDKEIPGKYKLYRIFEPHWKEVILLWFEQPEEWLKQQKEELIKRLVEFKDGCGEFYYYQAYFRSSIAISKNISTRLSKVIIEQNLQWSFGYFSEEKQTWMVFWEPIKESAKVVFNEINLPILIYTIAQFKDSNKKYDIMEVIRNIICKKSFHSQQLCLAALSPVIESVGDDKKKAILDILWSQFPNERLALAAFIESAGINYIIPEKKRDVPKDIDWYWILQEQSIREKVAEITQQSAFDSEIVIQAIFNLLDKTSNNFTIKKIANFLENSSLYKEQIISAFSKILGSASNEYIRWQAVESLEKISGDNELVISSFIELLQRSKDPDTRKKIFESITRIGYGNNKIISFLVELIQTTKDKEVQWQAVESIGIIGKGNKKAILALVQLIQTTQQDEYTRWLAAENLWRIDPKNKESASILNFFVQTYHLQSTEDRSINKEITDSFWHNADSAKENASLNLQQISITLQTSSIKNENPSNQLVDSLEEIAEINQKNAGCLITNKEAITLLSNLLETTRDETTRWQVADRLGIYEELLDLLINAKADNIRYQAALSLVKLGTNNPLVIDYLVQLCQNAQDESVRCQAALSLVKLGINNPLVIDCLVQLCQNAQNESVRCQSAGWLWEIDQGNAASILSIIQVFQMNENEHIRHEVASRLRSFVGLYRKLDIALDWSQERIDADFTDRDVIIDADFTNTDFIAQRSFNKSKAYKAMVANLSVFLTNDIYENNLQLYKLCYEVIWHCAKNLSYPDFYQAFHIQAENT